MPFLKRNHIEAGPCKLQKGKFLSEGWGVFLHPYQWPSLAYCVGLTDGCKQYVNGPPPPAQDVSPWPNGLVPPAEGLVVDGFVAVGPMKIGCPAWECGVRPMHVVLVLCDPDPGNNRQELSVPGKPLFESRFVEGKEMLLKAPDEEVHLLLLRRMSGGAWSVPMEMRGTEPYPSSRALEIWREDNKCHLAPGVADDLADGTVDTRMWDLYDDHVTFANTGACGWFFLREKESADRPMDSPGEVLASATLAPMSLGPTTRDGLLETGFFKDLCCCQPNCRVTGLVSGGALARAGVEVGDWLIGVSLQDSQLGLSASFARIQSPEQHKVMVNLLVVRDFNCPPCGKCRELPQEDPGLVALQEAHKKERERASAQPPGPHEPGGPGNDGDNHGPSDGGDDDDADDDDDSNGGKPAALSSKDSSKAPSSKPSSKASSSKQSSKAPSSRQLSTPGGKGNMPSAAVAAAAKATTPSGPGSSPHNDDAVLSAALPGESGSKVMSGRKTRRILTFSSETPSSASSGSVGVVDGASAISPAVDADAAAGTASPTAGAKVQILNVPSVPNNAVTETEVFDLCDSDSSSSTEGSEGEEPGEPIVHEGTDVAEPIGGDPSKVTLEKRKASCFTALSWKELEELETKLGGKLNVKENVDPSEEDKVAEYRVAKYKTDEQEPHKFVIYKVSKRIFRTLRPGEWVKDEVVGAYCNALQRRDNWLCQQDAKRGRCLFFPPYFMGCLLPGGDRNKLHYLGNRSSVQKFKSSAKGE